MIFTLNVTTRSITPSISKKLLDVTKEDVLGRLPPDLRNFVNHTADEHFRAATLGAYKIPRYDLELCLRYPEFAPEIMKRLQERLAMASDKYIADAIAKGRWYSEIADWLDYGTYRELIIKSMMYLHLLELVPMDFSKLDGYITNPLRFDLRQDAHDLYYESQNGFWQKYLNSLKQT